MNTNKITFLLVTGALLAPGCASQPEVSEPTIAFTNVSLVPADTERVLDNYTVVVQGDRIREVGPSTQVKAPPEALVVESAGRYLMPGFTEFHGHIPPPTAPPEYIESVLFLYLANGVTTVRGMLGHPNQLELREKARRGELLSPTLYLAGPSFSGRSVESAQQAEEKVRTQKQEGWDLLKIHPGVKLDHYDAMARTAKEVGISFAGHVPAEVGILHALEMGQKSIDHLDGYIEHLKGDQGPLDPAGLQEVVDKTREAGAWMVPTMVLWETIIGARSLETLQTHDGLQYMPPQEVQNWVEAGKRRMEAPEFDAERARLIAANRKVLLQALNEGGVGILFGTDAPQQFSVPGFSIYRELQAMKEAGMTDFQILQSGTRNAGVYFQDQDQFGTVEAGKRADLILLLANPLENIDNMAKRAGVMVRGRWFPEEEIQQRLADLAQSYSEAAAAAPSQ